MTSLPVRAIGFDLDNTLIDRDAALLRLLEAWVSPGNSQVLPELRTLDASGYGDRTAFFQLLGESMSPQVTAERAQARFRQEFPDFFQVEQESIELLQTLGSFGLPVALLSNGTSRLQRAKLRASGLEPFFPSQRILISEEIGCKKPDRRAFDLLGSALETNAILFVGDHPKNDLIPARAAGYHTAWMKRGISDETVDADFTVEQSILEIISWLGLQKS